MVITKKDKRLILLILSSFIALWFAITTLSSFFTKIHFRNSKIKILAEQNIVWLNSGRNIEIGDLENRIILLNFWKYNCIDCLHINPEIKKLEAEFGNRLTVIGVHSGELNNKKDVANIQKSILKYDISYPVAYDANLKIWNNFATPPLSSLILIDPKGNIVKKYQNEILSKNIHNDIKNLIKKYKYQLNNNSLPIILEKNKVADYILKFPSNIKFVRDFICDFPNKKISKTNVLIISNTGKNNIIVAGLNGETLLEIGSESSGFEDGNLNNATFNSPRGLLFADNILYVADTQNHALRKVNFKTGEVKTIAGNGVRGDIANGENKAQNTQLALPWNLEFFPDKNNIIISNSGTNQLLQYNISGQIIKPFAGNGNKDLIDGKYPQNSLARPIGLSSASGKLYFIDSESSSLRVVEKNGEVKTLIGKSLVDFGHKNGNIRDALMHHPTSLTADNNNIYITDTQNHKIRKYNFKTQELNDYSGNIRGDEIGGKNVNYNEPEAITSILDKFYIADTNNNRIVEINATNHNSNLLNILPQLKMPTDGLLDYLPNLEKITTQTVKSDDISLNIDIKAGWKINELAPSFINVVEIKNKKDANLIASFDSSIIKSGLIKLPKLSNKNTYYLQGTIYYCQDKVNAMCLMKSYEQKLEPATSGASKININFIYQ